MLVTLTHTIQEIVHNDSLVIILIGLRNQQPRNAKSVTWMHLKVTMHASAACAWNAFKKRQPYSA